MERPVDFHKNYLKNMEIWYDITNYLIKTKGQKEKGDSTAFNNEKNYILK